MAEYAITSLIQGSGLTYQGIGGEVVQPYRLVYLGGSDLWYAADADDASKMPALGLVTDTLNIGQRGRILLFGFVQNNLWSWTPGSPLYASQTPGLMTHTAPGGHVTQLVGYAVTATTVYFFGSSLYGMLFNLTSQWNSDEVDIAAAGHAGEQVLSAAVPAGSTRRIKQLTVRHAGSNPTVVTLLVDGGATKLTFDVPANTTRVWTSTDGRAFTVGQVPAVQSSDVTGGDTYVSASGSDVLVDEWNSNEVTVVATGAGGQQSLGAAVAATHERWIREITVRNAGSITTVVTILVSGGATKLTFDVPAYSTRVWGGLDGRMFSAAQQPAVQVSSVTGGSVYVSASGVEVGS